MIRHRSCWEQFFQQGAAGLREFIQRETGSGDLGEDRQHAGAGGGLEHQVIDTEPSRLRDDGCQRQGG